MPEGRDGCDGDGHGNAGLGGPGGGLGSRVALVVAQHHPVPMEFVGIRNTYAESGSREELFERFGLTAKHIIDAILRLV